MKEFKEFIKDVFQSKRKRAILSLILWFFFFMFIFMLIGNPREIQDYYEKKNEKKNVTEVPITESSLDNFKNMENFEFSYLIEIKENNINDIYKLEGTFYNNKYYFTTNGINYYINEDTIYVVDDSLKRLTPVKEVNPKSIFNRMNVILLTKDSIHTFISSSEENNTTSYKDGNITKNYTYKNYDGRLINITISEYGNIINNVELDFSKYINTSTYELFNVHATYKNINNIAEYNKNYDEYEIIKEGD